MPARSFTTTCLVIAILGMIAASMVAEAGGSAGRSGKAAICAPSHHECSR